VRFDRGGEEPTEEQRVNSWLVNLSVVGEHAAAERYFCDLAFAA